MYKFPLGKSSDMHTIAPPFRYGDFEGGIRGNAFVTGGYVPKSAVGSRFNGLVR